MIAERKRKANDAVTVKGITSQGNRARHLYCGSLSDTMARNSQDLRHNLVDNGCPDGIILVHPTKAYLAS